MQEVLILPNITKELPYRINNVHLVNQNVCLYETLTREKQVSYIIMLYSKISFLPTARFGVKNQLSSLIAFSDSMAASL